VLPAKYVEDRGYGLGVFGLLFTALLGVPGLLVWRMGIALLLGFPRRALLWFWTIAPLAALPWWGGVLPRVLAYASRDWAVVATDMLDDITRTTRLIASSPAEATLAGGERVVWQLDKGAYADTFGLVRFHPPDPAPTTPDAALAALKAQVAAQVRQLDADEQAGLFGRLEREEAAGLAATQALFTSAAEDALRDRETAPAVRRAARHFLSFAMNYNDWDLDALGR
jgi:hypothetical protein